MESGGGNPDLFELARVPSNNEMDPAPAPVATATDANGAANYAQQQEQPEALWSSLDQSVDDGGAGSSRQCTYPIYFQQQLAGYALIEENSPVVLEENDILLYSRGENSLTWLRDNAFSNTVDQQQQQQQQQQHQQSSDSDPLCWLEAGLASRKVLQINNRDLQYEAKAGEAVVLVVSDGGPSSAALASVTLHLQSANLAETTPVEIRDGVTAQPKGKFSTDDGEQEAMKRHAFRAYLSANDIGEGVRYFVDKDRHPKVTVPGDQKKINLKFLYVTHDLEKRSLWDLVVILRFQNGRVERVQIPIQVMCELKAPPKTKKRDAQNFYKFPKKQLDGSMLAGSRKRKPSQRCNPSGGGELSRLSSSTSTGANTPCMSDSEDAAALLTSGASKEQLLGSYERLQRRYVTAKRRKLEQESDDVIRWEIRRIQQQLRGCGNEDHGEDQEEHVGGSLKKENTV